MYVGWCSVPSAEPFPAIEISSDSGVAVVKRFEEAAERSSTQELSVLGRLGFLGSAIGLSGSRKREKKHKETRVVAKRRPEANFEGILTAARTTPCILWDHSKRAAWLLPATSVLAFASLEYAKWKDYSFRIKNNDIWADADLCLIQPTTDLAESAEDFLRKNARLLASTVRGQEIPDPSSFEQIARRIWEGMTVGEDVCSSELTGRLRKKENALFGYDLKEAVCCDRVQLRRLQASEGIQSWAPLCDVKRIQIIFCGEVGNVLACHCNWPMGPFPHSAKPNRGQLQALLEDLKTFYGEKWPLGTFDSMSLQIGEDYEWIPNRHAQCSPPPLQSINRKQSRLLRKMGSNPQLSNTSRTPSGPTLITFGS